jgi:hypothetical protein
MDGNRLIRRGLGPLLRRARAVLGDAKAVEQLRRQNARLGQRISQLENAGLDERLELIDNEIQELRSLGVRVAELTDLVAELIVHEARHRDDEYREIVARYIDAV